jgi:hypothetical protein
MPGLVLAVLVFLIVKLGMVAALELFLVWELIRRGGGQG